MPHGIENRSVVHVILFGVFVLQLNLVTYPVSATDFHPPETNLCTYPPDNLTEFKGMLFFTAWEEETGMELWKSA